MRALPRLLRSGVAFLAAGLLLAVAAAPVSAGEEPAAGPASGSVGIGLLEAPTDRAEDPRALVYVVDHLEPGDVIERRIELTNTTDAPVELDLYPAAATITDAGWTPLEGRTANALSSWTTVSPATAAVAPGERTIGTIRIVVPDDATPGEHYAVAWAQLPVAEGDTVDVVHRVGIRLYLSVGDGAEPASDFTINAVRAVTAPDGSRRLDVEVVNAGGRALDVTGSAMLTGGPGGTTAGPFTTPRGPTIAPGRTGVLVIPVPDDLPDGTWTAELTLRSGLLERTARAAVSWSDPALAATDLEPTGADDGRADLDVQTAGPGVGDFGRSAIALLAAALILAVLAATLRAGRRRAS